MNWASPSPSRLFWRLSPQTPSNLTPHEAPPSPHPLPPIQIATHALGTLPGRPRTTSDLLRLLAELAGFYAFFAGFVEQGVDFGLQVSLFCFEIQALFFDEFVVVAFVEFLGAVAYRFAFTETF